MTNRVKIVNMVIIFAIMLMEGSMPVLEFEGAGWKMQPLLEVFQKALLIRN